LKYMQFFRNVWAHGRSEAESQLNVVENVAALASGTWRETDEGLLETIVPPATTPSPHPQRSHVPLSTRLAALHSGNDVHNYLCDESWTTQVLEPMPTTWPANSSFSTGEFCPKEVAIAKDNKDVVGQALERSINRARTTFESAWLKQQQESANEWRQWVGKYTVKPILDDNGAEDVQEETSQVTMDKDKHREATESQKDGVANAEELDGTTETHMEEDDPMEVTDDDRTRSSGRDSATWSQSVEDLPTSSFPLPPPPPALGGDSDIHTSDEDPSPSKKTTGITRKRIRVSDEGLDGRRSRARGMEPDDIPGTPFTFAQRITRSVSAIQGQSTPNLADRARKASTSIKHKGKGKGKAPAN
jgi:hypothetical protein